MNLTDQITVVDVAPAPGERWLVVAAGAIIGTHATRKDAAKMARTLALLSKPSRLIVRGNDGEIETITPFTDDGCHC